MITGSCLCGEVSYEMEESKAGSAFHCHCSRLQKSYRVGEGDRCGNLKRTTLKFWQFPRLSRN